MEQILTLAASLEPGKPTSISNEDILPPGKSRTHRFITCLVLGSFLWSTIVPSMAMDSDFRDIKPSSLGALEWIQHLEEKRDSAIGRQNYLEAVTKEISATIAGKYGLSDRQATPEEREIILKSIVKTRQSHVDQLNIINDLYFAYNQPGCWQKTDTDQGFSSHMGVVAATDGLSWGLLSHEVAVQKAKLFVGSLKHCDPAEKTIQMPLVSKAIKDMVIGIHAARQSDKERSLLQKLQPTDWNYLASLSPDILELAETPWSTPFQGKGLESRTNHRHPKGAYTITRAQPEEDDDETISVTVRLVRDNGTSETFKARATKAEKPDFRRRPGRAEVSEPALVGTSYSRWVRDARAWVENHEARELFDVDFDDEEGVPTPLKLALEDSAYIPLETEVGINDSEKSKTTLFVRMLLNKTRLEDEVALEIPHAEISSIEEPRETRIVRRGDVLYYPRLFKKTYLRPSISGVVEDSRFDREQLLYAQKMICQEEQQINNGTYEVRVDRDYTQEDLFTNGNDFTISQPLEILDSPYLWGSGAEEGVSLYLTRTIKAIQMENRPYHSERIKGWIRYTAPTSLRVKVNILPISVVRSSPLGVFENIQGRWVLLNKDNYKPAENGSHYRWDIQEIVVPGDTKKSQFLLDMNHAKSVFDGSDLSQVKLVLSAPFASEEPDEFRGKNVPKCIPAFAILESAFYPPFPLPASLVNLTLTGPSSSPLSLNSGQAREIGSLRLLRTLRLQNVTISDTDLAISLRQALQHVTLNAVQSLGKETVRRLIALRTVSYPPLQTLILSDRLYFTDLFYGEHPYPTQALTRDMGVFLDQESNTPDRALAIGNRFKVSDTSKAKKYYRIAACQGNTVPSKEGAYQLAMLIKPSDKKEALTFFDRAAEANGREHPLAAFEAAKIHQDGSTIPSIPQDTARAKILFRAAADHAVARSAEQREATLLLGDLLRKSDSAPEKSQARTYYENLDDWHISDLSDPFKGKALLAHGQMLLNGEGGSVGYMTAIRKLDASRAFRNVPAQASQDWARATFEVARDLWIPEQRRKERKDRILGLITDDVIRLYYPAKAIQGALLAEGYYTPDQADGHILLAHINKAVEIFEGVLAHRLSEKSPNVLPFCHYWLGRLKRADISISTPDLEGWSGYPYYPQTINTHTDRPQALDYTLKVIRSTESGSASANALSRQDQELSKLWFGNLLWEIYKGSSDNTLLRRALMVSANHVWNIENNTQDTDTKAKALEIGLKMDGALKASGLGSIKSFPKQADTEEDDLVEKSQDEQDKQIAEAQARAAAEYAGFE